MNELRMSWTAFVRAFPWPASCGRRFATARGRDQHARQCVICVHHESGDPR